MQPLENEANDLQIINLTKDEMNSPILLLRNFTEDFSLSSVRKMLSTMTDICITTENVFCGDAKTREDLLYVSRNMARFFEAAYLFLKTHPAHDGKLIVHDFRTETQKANMKLLRVLQKVYFKSSPSGPLILPCITLSGRWLLQDGFNPGDEINIAHERHKLLITLNREWDLDNNDFKKRA